VKGKWHALHENDVRASTTPLPADENGVADPFPTGASVDVWWPNDNCFFRAIVLKTRERWDKRTKTRCREILHVTDGSMSSHAGLSTLGARRAPKKSLGGFSRQKGRFSHSDHTPLTHPSLSTSPSAGVTVKVKVKVRL